MNRYTTLSAGLCASAALALSLHPSDVFAVGAPSPSAVSSTTVKLPDGPGSVRGLADNADVSALTGQVSYAVPIELPSAAGGLSPSLSLAYGGDLGNGPLGLGWSFGQAGIRRSQRLGVPGYTEADELELVGVAGGGRLVAIGGGEYRIEGMGHAVRAVESGRGFVVTDSSGTIYEIGIADDTRMESGDRIAEWYVHTVTDLSGATLRYTYRPDGGQVYLEQIVWGPAGAFVADLVYESRHDDVITYRPGFEVVTAERLERIEVHAFTDKIRTVQLGYEDGFVLSRLSTVRIVGRGDVDEMPELAFSYASRESILPAALGNTGGWVLDHNDVSFFDVDNDGVMDLLRLEAGGHQYRRNLGGRFDEPRSLRGASSANLASARLLDLTGDSGAEMVRQVGDSWKAYRLGPTRWVYLGRWPGTEGLDLHDLAVADLNGDFQMDAVLAVGDGLNVWLGTGDGFEPPVSVGAIAPDDAWLTPNTEGVRFEEVNGDGLADVVYVGSTGLDIYLGHGDGTFASVKTIPYPFGVEAARSQVELGDLNRDGLMDLVYVAAGHVYWYRGTADGTFEATATMFERPAGTDDEVVVGLADANGNGSVDIVWSDDDTMELLDIAGPTSAGMLIGIDNGLGQLQWFDYASSAELSFADADSGEPWDLTMPVSIPVATGSHLTMAASGEERTTLLSVRDGAYDFDERQFAGFLETTRTNTGSTPEQTRREITRFHAGLGTDRVLRGEVLSQRVEDGNGLVYEEQTRTVEARPVAGLPAHPLLAKAAVTAVETAHYEGRAEPLRTRTTFVYDAEVRAVEEREEGRLDIAGDERTMVRRYASDDDTWVRDTVCTETLLGADDHVVAAKRYLFGNHAGDPLPLCEVGRGLLRSTEELLIIGELDAPDAPGGDDRWVETSSTTYDVHGNPVELKRGGVARTVTYDAHGLFALEESVVVNDTTTLTWTAEWDRALAQVTTLISPDGVVSRGTYDGLGRITSKSLGDQAPHQYFRYEWDRELPRTETWTFIGVTTGQMSAPVMEVEDGDAPFDPSWRRQIAVTNGAGEALYAATRLRDTEWIVSDWAERDARGRTVFVGDPVYVTGSLPTKRPAGMQGQTVAYDGMDRPTTQSLPTGVTRTMSYAAFASSMATIGLAPVVTETDGLGRPIETTRETEQVEAVFDAADRLLAYRIFGQDVPLVEHAFAYNSLGHLTAATGPDIGDRTLVSDDHGRLVAAFNGEGQGTHYTYDAAGRLATRSGGDATYTYHYDRSHATITGGRTAGKLAWVEEPTGYVAFGYDELGRVRSERRSIDGRVATQTVEYSPTGVLLSVAFDDGFAQSYSYDAAGRVESLDGRWQVDEQDAAGRILKETFGNGAVQRYERDALGMPSRITVKSAAEATLYDVAVTRNAWAALDKITDEDERGLDHSAAFTYDARARLTAATIGADDSKHSFAYAYDDLQNMTSRTATGPRVIGAMTGTYNYGERGHGPRQLTSIASGGAAHAFGYDAAGRVVAHDALTLVYDGLDQLVQVTGFGDGTTVRHAYGYDGSRIRTTAPDGTTTYWFTEGVSETDGVRTHYVRLGDRVIAEVDSAAPDAGGGAAAADFAIDASTASAVVTGAFALVLLLLLAASGRGRTPAPLGGRLAAAAAIAAMLHVACGSHTAGVGRDVQASTSTTRYYHYGVAAGPVLFTDADGILEVERRYEPFGEDIDSYSEADGVGEVDFDRVDFNVLNKQSDPKTGWSYHGARWMAPETGRWLTPDPPVKAPDLSYIAEPWSLHPYQYVDQNPVQFWDPDGRKKVTLYIGMNPKAKHEAYALRVSSRKHGKQRIISVLGNSEATSPVTYGGRAHDLRTKSGRSAFAGALPGTNASQQGAVAKWLGSVDAQTRDEMAKVAVVYAEASAGKFSLDRVVISGHHYGGSDKIRGDESGHINLSDIAELGTVFPKAAGQVNDLAYSACNSLRDDRNGGSQRATDIATAESMFPNLDTIWGYSGRSPTTHANQGGGATKHLQRWNEATHGRRSRLTGNEAKNHKHPKNVRVVNN